MNEWYSLDIVNWMTENHGVSALACFIKFQYTEKIPPEMSIWLFLKKKKIKMEQWDL